jgi:prevent-host-death family protein
VRAINIHEAKTHLSAVLAEIERTGEGVTICKNGVPVADLLPHRHGKRSEPHPTLSRIGIHFDPTEGMSSDDWPESER